MKSASYLSVIVATFFLSSVIVGALNPVIFFPGYGFSILKVTVEEQESFPSCKSSGIYELYFDGPDEMDDFNVTCMTNLLALEHNETNTDEPLLFTNLPGVTVELKDYPSVACASPFYDSYFQGLVNEGYQDGESLFVACYDWRTTPNIDVIENSNFVEDTMNLVVTAYENNGNSPVFLTGHSNGPIMAQYFINTLSQEQKDKYIAGFIPYAGNWAGAGLMYGILMQGLNVTNFSFLPETAATFENWPSTYFSLAQPDIFEDLIVVARTPTKNYTTQDYDQLFEDSGLTTAKKIWKKFVGLVHPSQYPNVPVVGYYGSGIETVVGIVMDDLIVGGVVKDYIVTLGDINQEYITNDAFLVWKNMKCKTFITHDLVDVDHFSMMSNSELIDGTVDVLSGVTRITNKCSSASTLSMPLLGWLY